MTQLAPRPSQRGLELAHKYCSTSWLEAVTVPLRPFPPEFQLPLRKRRSRVRRRWRKPAHHLFLASI